MSACLAAEAGRRPLARSAGPLAVDVAEQLVVGAEAFLHPEGAAPGVLGVVRALTPVHCRHCPQKGVVSYLAMVSMMTMVMMMMVVVVVMWWW